MASKKNSGKPHVGLKFPREIIALHHAFPVLAPIGGGRSYYSSFVCPINHVCTSPLSFLQVDQEEPTSSHTTTSTTKSSSISNNPTSSQKKSGMDDKAKLNKLMTTYDRLMPRYNSEAKRKMEDSESASSSEASSKAKKSCQNTAAKKEYSRLRTLVPALTEREDLSKVEIIEETIRYIDALHHQLASRTLEPAAAAVAPNEETVTEDLHESQPESKFGYMYCIVLLSKPHPSQCVTDAYFHGTAVWKKLSRKYVVVCTLERMRGCCLGSRWQYGMK